VLPASSQTTSGTGSVVVGWDSNPESQVIGYKVHYGTTPGVYTQIMDVGSVNEVKIPNLVDRLVYYCSVSAYSSNGVQSSYSKELAVVSSATADPAAATPRLILLEAEAGTLTAPMERRATTLEAWVESTGTSTAGAVTLPLNAAVAANYAVWCRVLAPNLSDSYSVIIDGSAEQTFLPNSGMASASSSWVWRRVKLGSAGTTQFPLSVGAHSIRFRTGSVGLKLDRVVLSSNPDFVPSDALPRSGDVIVVVGASTVQGSTSGSPVALQVDAVASGVLSYQWMKNGVLVSGATGPTLTLPAASAGEAASYSVSLWTGGIVQTAKSATLTIRKDPLLVKKITPGANQLVTFEVVGVTAGGVEVYASGNMNDWVQLAAPTISSNQIKVTDSASAGKTRFYRLVTR